MSETARRESDRVPRSAQLIAAAIVAALALTAGAGELEDLGFLVGHWRGEAFGGVVEEIWLPAEGDAMHGVFRAVSEGAMRFSEFIQVTVEDGDVIMRFAHFRPDYTTWEGSGPPMTLRLAEADASRAVFEGVGEASPDRITYTVDAAGVLTVEVTGLDAPLRFVRVD